MEEKGRESRESVSEKRMKRKGESRKRACIGRRGEGEPGDREERAGGVCEAKKCVGK